MKRLLLGAGVLLAGLALVVAPWADAGEKEITASKAGEKGWVRLFNGKDLTGWKTHPADGPSKWRVENGAIVSGGMKASHLFSDRGDYENFQYRIEAKISDKGNSGQYFRAKFAPGYPPGYEAQINSNSFDAIKTGSLYPSFKIPKEDRAKILEKILIKQELVPPDTWFTQEVIANGNHLIIKVNGKTTVDFVDKNNSFTRGHFALQQHTGFKKKGKDGKDIEIETVLHVRKVEVKELPPTK
jgi:hypothetical protein